ncbi:hypothetical protein scyTo_0016325, partial [Scyliorhinus torazame]|nr:hypothetical protein [Scyliorhinus torazame]
MAASKHVLTLSEDLTCSVCLSLFVEPVRLDCEHNFCKSCIQKCWENQGEEVSCPECRAVSPQRKCTSNRVLGNLCEKFRQLELTLEPEAVVSRCEEHDEKLKLFCEDDHTLICVICRDSPAHSQHSFLPVADATRKYKDQLKLSLDSMENEKKNQSELKQQQKMKISELEKLTGSLALGISAQFAKIHRYLEDKEKHLIEKLRRQKEKDLRAMEENLRRIEEELASLEETISNISVDIKQQDNVSFLQELKRLKECEAAGIEYGEAAGIEYDGDEEIENGEAAGILVSAGQKFAGFRGPLLYTVWKEMKQIITP